MTDSSQKVENHVEENDEEEDTYLKASFYHRKLSINKKRPQNKTELPCEKKHTFILILPGF